ncbi:hypothetical protein OG413_44385 [Streptomyces sp. NBC_01433]|uniref:hypothetical protein n=1 Tax=Streptomyces sp. NBC_01433 TaxID=2903864 RepID=UPI00224ECF94|nr:hypothetical protein [Streptomyces sp. NBC_01433]MCX4682223.1 hypothetical protein [Streptomyces sp. NBC_01433]
MSKAAGTVLAAWMLETRVSSPAEHLCVHVIPRDLSAVEGEDGPALHLMAPPNAEPRIKESASVVVVDATDAPSPNGAFDVLEEAVRGYPGVLVVGAVTGSCSALVWVRVQPPSVWQPVGYTVHVHTKGGQPEFYASALYGWMRWWLENLDQSALPAGCPPSVLLPRPPQMVEMVMAETSTQLSIRHTERVPDRPFEIHDPQDPLYR